MVLMVYSGDSGADGYAVTGEGLSGYAQEIMEQASALERQHGKQEGGAGYVEEEDGRTSIEELGGSGQHIETDQGGRD